MSRSSRPRRLHVGSGYLNFRAEGLRRLVGVTLVAAVLGGGGSAVANLTIVPTFDATINNDVNAATIKATINQAIANYAGAYSDATVVNILFQEMTSGLGRSNWWYNTYSY